MARTLNKPLLIRRRDPLTVSEAFFVVERLGQRCEQTMSIMAGVSRASIRRTVPLALQGGPPQRAAPRTHRPAAPLPGPAPRQASLSLQAAARELGLGADDLRTWLIRERWIRRGRCGALIAGARQLTATFLNQPVEQVEHGRRSVRITYGPIRITPRGMVSLRTQLGASRGDLS